jgi:DNA-binding MarR family transcriptional regulator
MQTNGLTVPQLAVLVTVVENEGLSQTDLVERTGIDRSTLADIVKRLKGKGQLPRKRTKEDTRTYAVKLTQEHPQRRDSLASRFALWQSTTLPPRLDGKPEADWHKMRAAKKSPKDQQQV